MSIYFHEPLPNLFNIRNDLKEFVLIFLCLECSGGQGILVCSSPWGHKESDTT